MYWYDGFLIRNIIAAIDHNTNVGRGVVSTSAEYKKSTKTHKLVDLYEEKDHSWRFSLVEDCVDYMKKGNKMVFTDDENKILYPNEISR